MTVTELRKELTNWAHTALAILGAVSFCIGLVTMALNANPGAHIDPRVSGFLVIAGAAVTTLSKMVDSLNNALTTGALPAPDVTNTTVVNTGENK